MTIEPMEFPRERSQAVAGRGDDMERIRAAAREFEAAMINAWWQAMQATFTEQDGDKLSGSSGALGDLSRQTMSAAIAEAGGLGFSSLIVSQLDKAGGSGAQVSANSADL